MATMGILGGVLMLGMMLGMFFGMHGRKGGGHRHTGSTNEPPASTTTVHGAREAPGEHAH